MDIDLYRFDQTVMDDEHEDEMDWIVEHGVPKNAYVVHVNEAPEELKQRLIAAGNKEDDVVMVIIQ